MKWRNKLEMLWARGESGEKGQTSVYQPPALPVFSSAPLLEGFDGSSGPSRTIVCRHPPQRGARRGAWSKGQQLDNWHNTHGNGILFLGYMDTMSYILI